MRPKKSEFTKWIEYVLREARIADYTYPVKGCGIRLPYGQKIRLGVIELMRRILEENGVEEVYFPTLIPKSVFEREKEFIEGFSGETYRVTHGGKEKLSEPLALRPTSETAMYRVFSKRVKNPGDLPIRIRQVANVFRYETKQTRPLIRVREITTFIEAHEAFATRDEAYEAFVKAIEAYKRFFDSLGIPYVISVRPDRDKFAGADMTVAFDTVMPTGRSLQIGTVHFLGQNFSKAFNISWGTPEGKKEYARQICYGISERVIMSIIAIHGDDYGLRLPSLVAPKKAIIIPIFGKKGAYKEVVEKYSLELSEEFGIPVDLTPETPGSKYYLYDLLGVPVRIEVGKKEADEGTLTIKLRAMKGRIRIKRDEFDLDKLLKMNDEELSRQARERFEGMRGGPMSFREAIDRMYDEYGRFRGGIYDVYATEKEARKYSEYVDVLGKPRGSDENIVRIARSYRFLYTTKRSSFFVPSFNTP